MTNTTIGIWSGTTLKNALERLPKEIKMMLKEYASFYNITEETLIKKYGGTDDRNRFNFNNLFLYFMPYYHRTIDSTIHFNELKSYSKNPIQTILQVEVIDFPLKSKMSLRDWYCRNARYRKVLSMFNKIGIFPNEDDFIVTIIHQ